MRFIMTPARIESLALRLLPATFVVMLLAPIQSAPAQLRHVEQLVYGMDCAPCAVGVQRRMERFEGVESVDINLNFGLVTLELDADNAVTLHAVRDSIHRGGFSPQFAVVDVVGAIETDDEGRLSLITVPDSDEVYRLRKVDEADLEAAEDDEQADAWRAAWQSLRDLEPLEADQRVLITGRVPKADRTDEPEPLPLHVREFSIVRVEDEPAEDR